MNFFSKIHKFLILVSLILIVFFIINFFTGLVNTNISLSTTLIVCACLLSAIVSQILFLYKKNRNK
jgi:drug/metabolite transporter (DMT)-like permease